MFRKLAAGLFVILFFTVSNVHAENNILPQKHALIKKLLTVTNLKKNTEITMDTSFEQMKSDTLPQMLDTALKQQLGEEAVAKIDPAKREKEIKAASIRIGDKIKKAVKEKFDMAQLAEDISFNLYNKYFTENELQAILDFYQSPAGSKAISLMPKMTADAMKIANETTNKLVIEIYFTTMKEEIPKLVNELFPSNCKEDQ